MTSLERITIRPEQCGGKPCVRGMRIRVLDVVGLIERGFTIDAVLKQPPDLDAEDVAACEAYSKGELA